MMKFSTVSDEEKGRMLANMSEQEKEAFYATLSPEEREKAKGLIAWENQTYP